MYFASNRPGGCGKHDLHIAYRDDVADDFGWRTPTNLGCRVNSPEEESCPVYHEDGARVTLDFVSTRAGGLGDWDVYHSRVVAGPATVTEPIALREVNSPGLEGHFAPLDDGTALIWSDRPGGHGGEDLYVSTRIATAADRQ
jgi:hypothetical protein